MVEITWLGHSTFEMKLPNGEVILTDPWLGNPKFPHGHKQNRIDTILISHGHFDHMADVIDLAGTYKSKVIANYEICSWLESKNVENCSAMNKGGTQAAGAAKVTMTTALHSSSILDDGKLLYGGEAGGYMIHFPDGRTAYFAGDTDIFGDMRLLAELYRPDLAFLPIGDLFTMAPKQAAMAAKMLRPKKIIPMHYGTFPPLVGRPHELAELIDDMPDISVWALEPGKTVKW